MKSVQAIKVAGAAFKFLADPIPLVGPLVLVFGNRLALEQVGLFAEIKELFPSGHIVFGSTSGEILGQSVYENSVVLTAIEFERGTFLVNRRNVTDFDNNDAKLGESLMSEFPQADLRHLFVISDGGLVNGSSLLKGLELYKNKNIGLSGGLCGDDDRFEKTLSGYNENPRVGEVVAIGFYGTSFEISSSNYGGWTPFGPERSVTRSNYNVLYELDGKPALDLYKAYLGEKALELPKSALLYPLSVKNPTEQNALVRTILNIDENENAMILAGDIPEGSIVQLMMSTVDDIAYGARLAAEFAMSNRSAAPQLAILISCVGRKLVMDQRTEEEIEEVISIIGSEVVVSGFYSYGEMAPFAGGDTCRLHNQTMTLTLFSE